MNHLPPYPAENKPVPFATLMRLEALDSRTFRSTCRAFAPGGELSPRPRTYGGHVYAQAVWAAAHTVAQGFVVHSVTGFFTLLGRPELPFVYRVNTIRNGRSFCVRSVTVTQEETQGACFVCTASFKLPDDRDAFNFQAHPDLHTEYAVALAGTAPYEHADFAHTEEAWFAKLPPSELSPSNPKIPPFPGLYSKKVDMRAYNTERAGEDARQLSFYATIGALPPTAHAPNLHAAAHLYASDRNSLFIIARHFGVSEERKGPLGSLSHTVVFHVGADALDMGSKSGEDASWFMQEAWSDRAGDGRGIHHSRMWDAEGRHIATTLQDGMVRVSGKGDGATGMRAKKKSMI